MTMRFKRYLSILLTIVAVSSTCMSAERQVDSTTIQREENGLLTAAACEEFQKLINATYNFKPSELSAAQQTTKSKEMDVVWEKVKANPKDLQPCLVAALESPSANSFLRFDGSTLLFSLDKSEASKKLVISSFAKSDLEDITLQNWIAYMLSFGLEGFDTSDAGDAWLRAKDPHYYLPQHGALKVDRRIGALAIYGSMDEKYATPALAKIASQKDHVGRDLAVSLLVTQVTPDALKFLKQLDTTGLSPTTRSAVTEFLTNPVFIEKRAGKPKISREEYLKAFQQMSEGRSDLFMQLVTRVPDGEKDAVAVLLPEDAQLVRKARRFFASTGTPHVPEWYKSFTDILMVLERKPDFEKKLTGD